MGGSDVLELRGFDWANLDITASKADDGSFFNLMFSQGDNACGDVTIDLNQGNMIDTLRLGSGGTELNMQALYDGASTVVSATLDDMSASLDAVVDAAQGTAIGEAIDMVFAENADPGVGGTDIQDEIA